MESQESEDKRCISYAPGHNVHWIQANVKRSETRFDVRIELQDADTVAVHYQGKTEEFLHHKTSAIKSNLDEAVLGYIKFAPAASLLYIQTKEPGDSHMGIFAVHFLANSSLTKCKYLFD